LGQGGCNAGGINPDSNIVRSAATTAARRS
jgi:hypothetical protein